MTHLSTKKKVNELKVKAAKSKGSIMSYWGTVLSPPAKKRKDNPTPCSPTQTESNSPKTQTMNETEITEFGK